MRFLKLSIISAVLISLAMSPVGKTVNIPDTVVAGEIGQKLDEYLTRLEGVGFNGSVLAAKDGDILIHQAYGIANVPTNTPVYTNTLFSTASVTKQFTAAGIMALVSDGKLNVDDPISKFFENVPESKWGIKIHHLLTHTAGLPPHTGPDDESITRDDWVRLVLAEPLRREPGGEYEYSNAGFSLAAAIIEKVSGKTFEQYLKDRLFTPAGMKFTGLQLLDVPDSLIAHSHNERLGYPSVADRPADHWHLTGGGGLLSTPADMYRWHLALKNNTVLPKEATDQMFTPHVREYPDQPGYYGYGWVIQKSQRRNATVIWHNGGAMPHGWGAAVYFYVEDDAVFIVFVNSPIGGEYPVDNICITMSQIVFGEEYPLPPVWQSVDRKSLAKLAGTYTVDDSATYLIDVSDDALLLQPRGQKAFDMLFPSRMAEMLPKYNRMTEEMIQEMSRGEFKKAASRWEVGPGDNILEMTEQFWHEFDTLGKFIKVESYGTILRQEAITSCRVTFEQGAVDLQAFWMQGKCAGFNEEAPPSKDLRPIDAGRFAAFSMMEGISPEVTFADGTMTIDTGRDLITAKRVK